MQEWLRESLRTQLEAMRGTPPKNLLARCRPDGEDQGVELKSSDISQVIVEVATNSPLMAVLGQLVHGWDAASADETWTKNTEPSTDKRRALICTILGFEEDASQVLRQKRPIYHDRNVVISGEWDDWYTPSRSRERAFYWDHYRDYLLKVRSWPEESVTALDRASTDVIRRLADPCSTTAYQSKGLVVGYVQSGKTANFTGVIAKAIDAGYRLIIVMTGTIELLRAQTQRRLDMELVGGRNIIGELSAEEAVEHGVDYQNDDAWRDGKFVDFGGEIPPTEIERLTHHKQDYKKQFLKLRIPRADTARPLFDPENLFRAAARLAIVKKNSGVLKKLVKDISTNRSAFKEIPVLIIDDESDQASVNTVNPEKIAKAEREGKEITKRRAINRHIAQMLELMPRAQFVGYTATPFANVFVDPTDEQGIFPKDFVIGLQRPPGYMGVEDFHDFPPAMPGPDVATSNRAAFVRDLVAEEETARDEELGRALDTFVLTGAVKLFRMKESGTLSFRHHTMLVHDSVKTTDHQQAAENVRRLWAEAAYGQPSAKERLKTLYNSDIAPVCEARVEEGVPRAPAFEALLRDIAETISRIEESGHNPVLIVNSDKDVKAQQQALDFDGNEVWRILVGGTKLSRGFTVEGLTVTFFRRATNRSDSLTQMGRWFGFRKGYRDLVRLFIARKARFGRKEVDLYEAFENISLAESAFRAQLEKYSEWVDDRPQIRPSQIPPLVTQHLPWLMPTARNKMFNAVLEEQSEQPFNPAGYSNHVDELKDAFQRWLPVAARANENVELRVGTGKQKFAAYVGIADAKDVLQSALKQRYLNNYSITTVQPRLAFFERLVTQGLLNDFLIVIPQPKKDVATADLPGLGLRAVVERNRREGRGNLFPEMFDRKHRKPLSAFVEGGTVEEPLKKFVEGRRGLLILSFAKEKKPSFDRSPKPETQQRDPLFGIVTAYSMYAPKAAVPASPVLRFKVRNPAAADAIVVKLTEDP